MFIVKTDEKNVDYEPVRLVSSSSLFPKRRLSVQLSYTGTQSKTPLLSPEEVETRNRVNGVGGSIESNRVKK